MCSAKCSGGLQLKAGEFEDIPLIVTGIFRHGDNGSADVSTHLSGHSGRLQNVTDQRGSGSFSVGSGNTDRFASQKWRSQFDLADHIDSAGAGLLQRLEIRRDAGGEHD